MEERRIQPGDGKSSIEINHLLHSIETPFQSALMMDIILWSKKEPFDSKHAIGFIRKNDLASKEIAAKRGLPFSGFIHGISLDEETAKGRMQILKTRKEITYYLCKKRLLKKYNALHHTDQLGTKQRGMDEDISPCHDETCWQIPGKHSIRHCPNSSDSLNLNLLNLPDA